MAKILKHSKLSPYKIKKILKYFSEDFTATQTANLTNFSRVTVNRYYKIFRKQIAQYCQAGYSLNNEYQLESYHQSDLQHDNFIPAFGIFNKNNMIIIERISDDISEYLSRIYQKDELREYLQDNNTLKNYNSILINGNKYILIDQKAGLDLEKKHLITTESFWSYCKRRLAKYNGIKNQEYYLHIKECEFRWNHRSDDIFEILRKIMKGF